MKTGVGSPISAERSLVKLASDCKEFPRSEEHERANRLSIDKAEGAKCGDGSSVEADEGSTGCLPQRKGEKKRQALMMKKRYYVSKFPGFTIA